jgi:hypothetical protein
MLQEKIILNHEPKRNSSHSYSYAGFELGPISTPRWNKFKVESVHNKSLKAALLGILPTHALNIQKHAIRAITAQRNLGAERSVRFDSE